MTVKVSKPAINVREELADLKKPTGIAGQDMLAAETPQEQFNLIGAGRKNILINGDHRIAQRGTSSAGLDQANDGYYTVDRWKFIGSGSSRNAGILTISQETDAPDDFKYSTKFLVTTADTDMGADGALRLETHLEAQDIRHLNSGSSSAKQVTLSFWVKSNKTGSYTAGLYMDSTPSGTDKEISQGYTINASGNWEYKTLTFAANTTTTMNNTDNDHGLRVWFHQAAGSNYTSGTSNTWGDSTHRAVGQSVNLYDATNNYWQITGVQLEVGKVATPFEHRSYGEELALCQRYFYKRDLGGIGLGNAYQANAWNYQYFSHPVTMRAAPTTTYTGGTQGTWPTANAKGVVSNEHRLSVYHKSTGAVSDVYIASNTPLIVSDDAEL